MLAVLTGLLIAGKVGTFGHLAPTVLALVGLAAWTSASILWADSPDRAWTESDRLVLYTAVFAICVVALRTPRDVRRSLAVVGAVIAAAALYAVVALLRGDPGAFLDHRLDMPIGYINGAAGLFLIGLWPLVSLAERATRPLLAGAAMALAVVEANLLVLTQSRAILPAVLVSAGVLLALYPGRTVRAWTLLAIAAGAAAASPWTLAIYADRIPRRPRPCPRDLAQPAAIAALVAARRRGCDLGRRCSRGARGRASGPAAPRRVGAAARRAVRRRAVLVAAGDPVARVEREWRAFTTLQVDESSTTRFTGAGGYRHDLWRVALDDVRREPLLGVGAGSYGLSYYQQRRQVENVRQPHSLPLQVARGARPRRRACWRSSRLRPRAWAVFRNRRADVAAGVAGHGHGGELGDADERRLAVQPAGDHLHRDRRARRGDAARDRRPLAAGGAGAGSCSIGAALPIAVAAASLGRHYSASVYAERRTRRASGSPARALAAKGTITCSSIPMRCETYYTRAAAYARLDDYARARAHTDAGRRARALELRAMGADRRSRRAAAEMRRARRAYAPRCSAQPARLRAARARRRPAKRARDEHGAAARRCRPRPTSSPAPAGRAPEPLELAAHAAGERRLHARAGARARVAAAVRRRRRRRCYR